jgi:hypothetical protein
VAVSESYRTAKRPIGMDSYRPPGVRVMVSVMARVMVSRAAKSNGVRSSRSPARPQVSG